MTTQLTLLAQWQAQNRWSIVSVITKNMIVVCGLMVCGPEAFVHLKMLVDPHQQHGQMQERLLSWGLR